MPAKVDPFFPAIGDAAEKTDQLADVDDAAADTKGVGEVAAKDEDRPLEEIESLCMSCGEQVIKVFFVLFPRYCVNAAGSRE
jgi:hypothetical protein